MKSRNQFDNIIAMNLGLIALGTVAVGTQALSNIPQMNEALSKSAPRLQPMKEVIEFTNGQAVLKTARK